MFDRIEGPYGPYADAYREFFELTGKYKGYEFGKGPGIKRSPPTVTFDQPLKWWSLDRPKRLRAIRQERDRYLSEILNRGKWGDALAQDVCDKSRRVAGNRTKGFRRGQEPISRENRSRMSRKDRQAA